MSIPAIIVIVLFAVSLGMDIVRNGEPQKVRHEFWPSFFATATFVGLLYWGGFFNPVH